ncbi:MAG: uridine diphosphate-N-acetylglucosamine-binding protein YvcK [Actinobacteria bacterium]|nr:uridine diphosphate-N-acetylglucosamine-binding protein YvcK [Actinomycetota bacterium]NBY15721.1 uridine diphosphate-N-acetylglucosamine-binding protein YvcK [Actinomycetota bacterium]
MNSPIRPPDVVALGGGHGLAASLSALRQVTPHLTAVVGVSDDGGSSGRLRKQFDVVPPGDLRMALAALCGDDTWGSTWARVLQHRFQSNGDLDGHALGNLLIAALWQETGDVVAGLDWVAKLLDAQGRVLPLSTEPLDIVATVVNAQGATRQVQGQSKVAVVTDDIESIRLIPEAPSACQQAIDAVIQADVVVLGPGSWFTSVLPHFYLPQMRDALHATRAKRILVLNLQPQVGETHDYQAAHYLRDLATAQPEFRVDLVLADAQQAPNKHILTEAAAVIGAEVLFGEVANDEPPFDRHDGKKLASLFRSALKHGKIGSWQ